MVVDAIARDDKVETNIIENKSGRQAIQPKIIIDCSADGDIVSVPISLTIVKWNVRHLWAGELYRQSPRQIQDAP